MPTTDEDDYTSHMLVQGSGHLVTYDKTPPRSKARKPIGFNATFPPKKPPVKKPAKRKKR